MKICMLLDNPYPPDYRPKRAIDALIEAGHEVDLYAEPGGNLPDLEKEEGLRIFRKIRPWQMTIRKNCTRLFHAQNEFVTGLGKEDYAVVHCNDWLTLPYGVLLKKLYGVKLVYDSHEYFTGYNTFQAGKGLVRDNINKVKRFIRLYKEKQGGHLADQVITVSDEIADLLKIRFKRTKLPKVIRNIPDINVSEQKIDFNRLLKVAMESFFIIHSGNIRIKSRCLDNLLLALQMLPQEFNLIFLGKGPDVNGLERMAEDMKLKARVHLLGAVPQEEMMQYLQGAHAGIALLDLKVKNNYLALPNKFFEYILAGIPQVASNSPSQSKYLGKYKFGVPVNPNSPKEISEAILAICNNYQNFKKNTLKSRNIFSWEKEKIKLINCYREIAIS